MKNNFEKKHIKKFFVNKKTLILSFILAAACLFGYIYLEMQQGQANLELLIDSELPKIELLKRVNQIEVWQTFLVMLFSGATSSIFSIIIIDVKENNSIVSDLIKNDVFSSNEFYSLINKENKKKVLETLETDLYFNQNKALEEMFLSTKETICESLKKQEYYFDKCDISIKCTVHNDYIEKRILKTLRLKSYKNSDKSKNYQLLSCSYQDNNTYKPVELVSLSIAGKNIEPNDKRVVEKCTKPQEPLSNKIGYDKKKEYFYKNDIDLSSKRCCEIKVEYITRVPLTDNLYSFRTPNPCKSFNFSFDLVDSIDYDIKTIAFGFADDANKTPNVKDDKKSVKIAFDNWIFPYDGVAVVINKR